MKRNFLKILVAVCCLFIKPTTQLFAQEFANSTTAITDELLSKITGVGAPQIFNDCIVFTAEHNAHFVGIAFDFENFRTIHAFKLRKVKDIDGKDVDSWYFYILDIPKGYESISYRLIIDGLWTTDPMNTLTEYNTETGIRLSSVKTGQKIETVTHADESNTVRFIYRGETGQEIRIGGTFTNWDSWIYKLKETSPGFYELSLPLPEGTYYYSFFHGMNRFVDQTNPNRAYTIDGRIASVVQVKAPSLY